MYGCEWLFSLGEWIHVVDATGVAVVVRTRGDGWWITNLEDGETGEIMRGGTCYRTARDAMQAATDRKAWGMVCAPDMAVRARMVRTLTIIAE